MKLVLLAEAEAEKIRKIGEAEAAVIEAMGKAEAERMKLKAEAYQKYGDSAKMAMVLDALPQVSPSRASTGISLGLVRNTATGWLGGLNGGVFSSRRNLQQASRLWLSNKGHPGYSGGLGEMGRGEMLGGANGWRQNQPTQLSSHPTS